MKSFVKFMTRIPRKYLPKIDRAMSRACSINADPNATSVDYEEVEGELEELHRTVGLDAVKAWGSELSERIGYKKMAITEILERSEKLREIAKGIATWGVFPAFLVYTIFTAPSRPFYPNLVGMPTMPPLMPHVNVSLEPSLGWRPLGSSFGSLSAPVFEPERPRAVARAAAVVPNAPLVTARAAVPSPPLVMAAVQAPAQAWVAPMYSSFEDLANKACQDPGSMRQEGLDAFGFPSGMYYVPSKTNGMSDCAWRLYSLLLQLNHDRTLARLGVGWLQQQVAELKTPAQIYYSQPPGRERRRPQEPDPEPAPQKTPEPQRPQEPDKRPLYHKGPAHEQAESIKKTGVWRGQ